MATPKKPNRSFVLTTHNALSEAWGDPVGMTGVQTNLLSKKKILLAWYRKIYCFAKYHIAKQSPTIEMGSGSSKLYEHIDGLIRSNILVIPENDLAFSAFAMPFKDGSVGNLVLINVLHHFQDPYVFFREAERVLKPGGRILISDPYISLLSYPVWRYLHPENCDRNRVGFNMNGEVNPLIDANSATATNLFCGKDSRLFQEYKNLRLVNVSLHSKFLYWTAGGYNFPQLIPTFILPAVEFAEMLLSPFDKWLASFMFAVVEKKDPVHV